MLTSIAAVAADLIALVLLGLVIAFWFLGYAIGRRASKRGASDAGAQVKIAEACMAILGLILAFSFAAAYTKFEARRQMVVRESNSIGTFLIRQRLLPADARTTVEADLRQYVQMHLDIVQTKFDLERQTDLDSRMRALQDQIVNTVLTTVQQPEYRHLSIPLLMSMNDMLDQYEARMTVARDRVPPAVIWLLLVVSVISAVLFGKAQGLAAQKSTPWVTIIFLMMIVFIIYVTLDLDQPTHGISRTTQFPMVRLAQSMGLPIPEGLP